MYPPALQCDFVAPVIERWGPYPLSLDQLCHLVWPTKWGRSDTVYQFSGLNLKNCVLFSPFSLCHENMPRWAFWTDMQKAESVQLSHVMIQIHETAQIRSANPFSQPAAGEPRSPESLSQLIRFVNKKNTRPVVCHEDLMFVSHLTYIRQEITDTSPYFYKHLLDT